MEAAVTVEVSDGWVVVIVMLEGFKQWMVEDLVLITILHLLSLAKNVLTLVEKDLQVEKELVLLNSLLDLFQGHLPKMIYGLSLKIMGV